MAGLTEDVDCRDRWKESSRQRNTNRNTADGVAEPGLRWQRSKPGAGGNLSATAADVVQWLTAGRQRSYPAMANHTGTGDHTARVCKPKKQQQQKKQR